MPEEVKVKDLIKLRETDLAILFTASEREIWLPRSQISHMITYGTKPDNTTTITIPEWLAKDKKLDYE